MVLSWKRPKKSTPDQELEEILKRKEEVDIPAWVKEEVQENLECPPKSSGCVGKESLEDFSENIENLRKLINISNINLYRYHKFYLASKGNQFKNKTVLIEHIHKSKAEKIKSTKLADQ